MRLTTNTLPVAKALVKLCHLEDVDLPGMSSTGDADPVTALDVLNLFDEEVPIFVLLAV
jgi:hypothetical protein